MTALRKSLPIGAAEPARPTSSTEGASAPSSLTPCDTCCGRGAIFTGGAYFECYDCEGRGEYYLTPAQKADQARVAEMTRAELDAAVEAAKARINEAFAANRILDIPVQDLGNGRARCEA